MSDFSERDWKILRRLRQVALERFCKRILSEAVYIATDPEKSFHKSYLALWDRLHERNDELAAAFDNPRRSAAFDHLALIKRYGLLTDKELSQFSEHTLDTLRTFYEIQSA